jgi:hypothetical protein
VFIQLDVPSIMPRDPESRRTTVLRIKDVALKMKTPSFSVALLEIRGRCDIETPSPFGSPHVVWVNKFATDIGPTESALVDAVRLKSDQARKGKWTVPPSANSEDVGW